MLTESNLFLLEAFDLISCTTILGAFYGVVFVLYCLCTWSLYLQLQEPDKRRQARFSLGCTSLLFIFLTCSLALNLRVTQLAYIDHADFPGEPFEYETRGGPPLNLLDGTDGILEFVVNVLTMMIQLRRLWIIWSGKQYRVVVTTIPLLLLFSYMALDVLINIAPNFVPLDQPVIFGNLKAFVAVVTAAYGTMPGFTILVTGLIAARLLLARRQHMKIMGTSHAASPYLTITAILTESYALDSAWSLGAAISTSKNKLILLLFTPNDPTIKVIAYFLVVCRVANGKGWTKQTEENLTSLRWNHDSQVSTDEASGIRSQTPAATTIVAMDSPPATHTDLAV